MQQATDTYGRNRDSVAELQCRLKDLFSSQPGCQEADGEVTIPIQQVGHVLRIFLSENDLDPLSPQHEVQIQVLVDSQPSIRLTPAHLFDTLLALTSSKAQEEPPPLPPKDLSPDEDEENTIYYRGRPGSSSRQHSRSSSSDSVTTAQRRSDEPLRWSGGPETPNSPFENKNRQRSQRIEPPSSWTGGKRPAPASKRRRSDAGSAHGSDNEVRLFFHGIIKAQC